MKWISLVLILFVQGFIFGQKGSFQIDKKFTPNELQEDFKICFDALKSVHPSLYHYTSQSDFEKLYSQHLSGLNDSLTHDEFHVIVRQFIKHVKCGHTTTLPSLEWYAYQRKESKVIPLNIFFIDGEFFVHQSSDSTLPVGSKILSIDSHSYQDIIADMKDITERDGLSFSFVESKIENLFRTYYLFLYGRQDYYQVEYIDPSGNKKSITLEGGASLIKPKTNKPVTKYIDQAKTSGGSFYIKSDETSKYAVLDLNSFQSKGYKKFYKAMFKSIESNNVKNLIIDLRGNGGGYFPNGTHLLEYLLDEQFEVNFSRWNRGIKTDKNLTMDIGSKFTKFLFLTMPGNVKTDDRIEHTIKYKPVKKYHFKGQIYVLIDGSSFSMGGYMPAKLKHYKKAIFIGEETGGGEEGSNAVLFYTLNLPNTHLRVKLPYYFLDHKVNVNEPGRGIIPDHTIKYALKYRISNQDLDMEKTISLLKQKKG